MINEDIEYEIDNSEIFIQETCTDNKRLKKSTEREVFEGDIYGDLDEVSITIHADDFWPNMARIIVGTLLEVGTGKMEADFVSAIIESKDRGNAGETADAKGLFLSEVKY